MPYSWDMWWGLSWWEKREQGEFETLHLFVVFMKKRVENIDLIFSRIFLPFPKFKEWILWPYRYNWLKRQSTCLDIFTALFKKKKAALVFRMIICYDLSSTNLFDGKETLNFTNKGFDEFILKLFTRFQLIYSI